MKITRNITLFFSLCMLAMAWSCDGGAGAAAPTTTLDDSTDSLSYIIGMDMGRNFKGQNLEVDADRVAMGIRDGFSDSTKITDEQAGAFMNRFQQTQVAKLGDENRANGKAFLAENQAKEGVQLHESGLQYKVLQPGSGASPSVTDQVTIHYRGTLIDGTEFDSSLKPAPGGGEPQPVTFPLANLIQAWQIALPLMKEGGKWEIYAPENLAYGEMAPPSIGPGQTLVFYIELIKVVK